MSEIESSNLQPIGADEQVSPQIINDDGIDVIVNAGDLSKDINEHQELVNKLKNNDVQNSNNQAGDYKYNPLWDIAKSYFENNGINFELPEALKVGKINDNPLTAEDEFNLLKENIIKNTRFGFEEDPIVQYYLFAKERNPDINSMDILEEYKTSMTIHSMDDDVFLSNYLKANNPEIGDDEIQETITKLGNRKSEASEQLKQEVLKGFYETHDSISKQKETEYENYMKQYDKKRESEINLLFSDVSKDKKIGELKLDDNTFNELNSEFKNMFIRSNENPIVTINVPEKFANMLSENNDLLKMVAYHKYGDKLIKEEIERRKSELEEQLGVKPRIDGIAQRQGGFIEPI